MATKQYPLIAREGYTRLALIAAVASTLTLSLGFTAGLPAWLFFLLVLWLFRDPTRIPPSIPLAIVSPVHGKVVDAGSERDPWLERDAERVTIHNSLFDISSIYSPTEGKIMRQWRGGASSTDSTEPDGRLRDTVAFWIQTDELDDVVLEIARRGLPGPMNFRYNPGERVGQGRRVGFVNNGCTARVYLPKGSMIAVSPGETVQAASATIASLVHMTAMAKAPDEVQEPRDS